jgi:hypothetical protein
MLKLAYRDMKYLCLKSVCLLLRRMGMRRSKTLQEKIEKRIDRRRNEDVFLPREFADLGGKDQVLRALYSLVRDKRLVRLGYGVYGRAVVSRLSGEPILYSADGFLVW